MAQSHGHAYDKLYRRSVVGTAWTLLAYANPARRWLWVQSVATEDLEIGFSNDADAPSHGFLLAKPSTITNDTTIRSHVEQTVEWGNLTRQAIWGRCASGSMTVIIGEAPAANVPEEPDVGLSSSHSESSSESTYSASTATASSASSINSSSRSASSVDSSTRSASTYSASSLSSPSSIDSSSRSASSASASSRSTETASSISSEG